MDEKTFIVSPPVPAGTPVKIKIQCYENPKVGAAVDAIPIDGKWHNAILEWMRYRALAVDEESTSSFTRAQFHLQHFYQIIGLSRDAINALVGKKMRNVTTTGPAA
jgi:hypothetical protein